MKKPKSSVQNLSEAPVRALLPCYDLFSVAIWGRKVKAIDLDLL